MIRQLTHLKPVVSLRTEQLVISLVESDLVMPAIFVSWDRKVLPPPYESCKKYVQMRIAVERQPGPSKAWKLCFLLYLYSLSIYEHSLCVLTVFGLRQTFFARKMTNLRETK